MHLADAYLRGDLGLRLSLVEAQLEYLLLLTLETFYRLLQEDLVFHAVYRRVGVGLEVYYRVALGVVLVDRGV